MSPTHKNVEPNRYETGKMYRSNRKAKKKKAITPQPQLAHKNSVNDLITMSIIAQNKRYCPVALFAACPTNYLRNKTSIWEKEKRGGL